VDILVPAWDDPVGPEGEPRYRSHRAGTGKSRRLVTIGVVIALAAANILAVTAMRRPDRVTGSPEPGPSTMATTGAATASAPGADIVVPDVPSGLRVTGRSVSGVSLDWSPATDNVGVAGYVVLRDGVRVGTTADPGYTDARLTSDSTYTYAVAAFDAAGNTSDRSAAVTAMTLADADAAPPSTPHSSPPTSAPPHEAPIVESARLTALQSECTVSIEATVVASAPMTADLTYTVDNRTGAKPLVFTAGDLTQNVSLGTFTDTDGGIAFVRVGGASDVTSWASCAGLRQD
jgi:chitodextrinase